MSNIKDKIKMWTSIDTLFKCFFVGGGIIGIANIIKDAIKDD